MCSFKVDLNKMLNDSTQRERVSLWLNRSGQLDEEKMVADDGRGNLVTTAFRSKHNSKKFPATPFQASNLPLYLPKDQHFSRAKVKSLLRCVWSTPIFDVVNSSHPSSAGKHEVERYLATIVALSFPSTCCTRTDERRPPPSDNIRGRGNPGQRSRKVIRTMPMVVMITSITIKITITILKWPCALSTHQSASPLPHHCHGLAPQLHQNHLCHYLHHYRHHHHLYHHHCSTVRARDKRVIGLIVSPLGLGKG